MKITFVNRTGEDQTIDIRFRYSFGVNFLMDTDAEGDMTDCLIDGDICGVAFCSPRDRICKATGRKVALTRALAYRFVKLERAQIWRTYFTQTNKKFRV